MTVACPSLGCKMPVSILMVVDLPAPLGPMKANISPFSSEKLTSETAVISSVSGFHKARRLPLSPGALRFSENRLAKPLTFTAS